jgi:Uma2 family endonuclease
MVIKTKTMTAEDLWRMPDDGHDYELVKGELIEMVPPGGQHGDIARRLAGKLGDLTDAHRLGRVLVETGFWLARQPDTVRGPDISFITAERIPPGGLPVGFFPGAPDLAVEIVSPSDTASAIQAKVQDYLTYGTRLVWVVDPKTQTVTVYRPDGSAHVLGTNDTLSGEDLVPGFTLRITELFGAA